MIDVHIFTNLQKGLQKSNLVLPDVLTLRDIAVRKFNILVSGPMPGGKEEEAINRNKQNNVTIHNHLAAEENMEQIYSEIRCKITSSARDFTAQRLNIETDASIQLMKNLLTAKTLPSLIKSSVAALKFFFIKYGERYKIEKITHEICFKKHSNNRNDWLPVQ